MQNKLKSMNKHLIFHIFSNKTDLDIFMVNWPLSVISILRHTRTHAICVFLYFVHFIPFLTSHLSSLNRQLEMFFKSRTILSFFLLNNIPIVRPSIHIGIVVNQCTGIVNYCLYTIECARQSVKNDYG